MKIRFNLLVLIVSLVMFRVTAHAQVLYEVDFDTNGDYEDWVDFQNRGSSSVIGGLVSGTSPGPNQDVQLRTDFDLDISLPAGSLITIRWRETSDGSTALAASALGNGNGRLFGGDHEYGHPGATNQSGTNIGVGVAMSIVDDSDGFVIGVWDIGTWFGNLSGGQVDDGDLDSLRFDPNSTGSLAGSWDVDYLRILQVDEGDANLDGNVDSLDFQLISDNLFNNVATGTNGDITDDGVVNYADYRLWRDRIDALAFGSGVQVPEPTSAAILLIGAVSLLATQRRRSATPKQVLMLLLAVSLLCVGSSAQAQVVYTADFNTNGDAEGWTGINTSPLSVSGGLLSGSIPTGNDPQLINEFSTPIGGSFNFDTLSFRVRETPPVTSSPFNPQGLVVTISSSETTAETVFSAAGLFSAVDSGSNFFTIDVDISGFNGIDIDRLRVDPMGGPDAVGGAFEVDFIEITRGPLFGDVNNDGNIDLIDKNIIRDNLFETNQTRADGDLNGDGLVSFDDFHQWKDFYVPPAGSSANIVIPEPNSSLLIILAAVLTLTVVRGNRNKEKLALATVRGVALAFFTLVIGSNAHAVDVNWLQSSDNNYANDANWDGGFTPEGSLDELAIIGNSALPVGVANVQSGSTPPSPGGITLGGGAGTNGTLNILSGGSLTVAPGQTTGAGNINVGGANGTGILNVNSGGSLTAQGIFLAGETGSQVNLNGTAQVNLLGNSNLTRTTTVNGSSVNFTSQGNVTFNGTSTYVPEINGSSLSTLNVAGTATLGGTLNVNFTGAAPVAGNTWDLIDASGISGNFSSIVTPGVTLGFGESFRVRNVFDPSSTNGRVAQLSLDQLLVAQVNRTTGDISIMNPNGTAAVGFDGYSIRSTSGSINTANWNSLQDNGSFTSWEEAQNSDSNRITEIKIEGDEFLGASSSVSLGNIFNPQLTSFGVTGEDIFFQYTRSDSSNSIGIVQYTGALPTNNNTLVLQIDPATGESILYNDSNVFDGSIQGYDISSASGSLLSGDGDWQSLDDANAAGGDWRESNVSANRVAELKEAGQTLFTMNGGTSFDLGTLFDTNGEQDLVLQFLQAGDSEPTQGIVIYESISAFAGDFDGDGDVDLDDLNGAQGWQARYGSDLFGGDFLAWQRNFGAGTNAQVSASAVPEPASVALLLASSLVVFVRQRSNPCRTC